MSHYDYDYDYDGYLCVALFDVWSISSEAGTYRVSIISIGPESDNCLPCYNKYYLSWTSPDILEPLVMSRLLEPN